MTRSKMVFAAAVIAIWSGGLSSPRATSSRVPSEGFTPAQRKVADEIVSIFENDTPNLQYGYVENLHDGRGYTAGRGGFTSATGDMYRVLQLYSQTKPDNPFLPYMDALKETSAKYDDSVDNLAGLDKLWTATAIDPAFCRCQDQVVDELAYQPAVTHWKAEGCKTPLALLVLYDTVVEQGDDNDPDGTPANISRASALAGGNPASGVDEKTWLRDFLNVRSQILVHPSDQKTQEAWADSVDRCYALDGLVLDEDWDLSGSLDVNVFGEQWTVTENGGFRSNE